MTSCHTTTVVRPEDSKATQRVALIGMPNTGKSTFFNRITGVAAHVGNWPGVTVDLLQANVPINGKTTEFVDLPGIYDLNGFTDDEKVVQNFLENYAIDLVIVVINASQIDRQIRMPLQIKALGLPAVLMLNMADEAKQYGVHIDTDKLAANLGIPVFLISAKYGKGYMKAYTEISEYLALEELPVRVNDVEKALTEEGEIHPETIAAALDEAVQMPSQMAQTITTRLDSILLHPVFGLPLFFLGMFLVFWVVWNIGLPSQDVAGSITDWVEAHIVEPVIAPFPAIVQDFVINGIWNGVATVASFVPLVIIFFIVFAALEDSGYLSRSAYLMDALMTRMGLDGRSFVLQMTGFGCNVPALMGTRVMRSPALRMLTMLIIPFALCSARLQVFVFIIAAVFPNGNGALVLFSLYVLSFVAAIVTALIFQGKFENNEPFVLEVPPYRWPTLKQVILKAWSEVKEFLQRASGFITVGCIAIWVLTNLPPGATGLNTFGGQIGQFLSPIMRPIGIDPALTLALIFGFIAKEVVLGSLAVIYHMKSAGVSHHLAETLTFAQGYSFCIFCLLYTPCITTIVTMYNEAKSLRFTLFSLVFSFALAWVGSFIFYQGALLLGFQ
ncbi:MAG: ferrous iron transport protein B [Cyanobacteria bacterium J06592_8]